MNQNDFMTIVNPFKDKLFRMAKRLLVSTEEAEDATQEVLVKLWSRNENFNAYKNVEAMAITMTKNYCLDQLKSKRAGNLQIVHNNFTDESYKLEQQFENRNSLEWIEKIIENLPEQQKILLHLRDIEQLEFDEIAQITSMSQTAIRVALSRARKTIREKMTKTHQYGII